MGFLKMVKTHLRPNLENKESEQAGHNNHGVAGKSYNRSDKQIQVKQV